MTLPPEREVKDFQFKQLLKVKVSALPAEVTKKRVNLVATSNKYGLSFIGTDTGFRVLRTADVVAKATAIGKSTTAIIEDVAFWNTVQLQSTPVFLGLSSDSLTLAVCIKANDWSFALMYDVRSFADQNAPVQPFLHVKLGDTPHTELRDAMWNPGAEFASLFAVAMGDGSLQLFVVKETLTIMASLPAAACVTCICWSPKGKQLLAGRADGSFTQYDQALKEKKKVPAPTDLFNGKPVSVLDVLWESTFVYIAAFLPAQPASGDQPSVLHTTCAKNTPVTHTLLEDVCFGGGEDRAHKYFFTMLADWKLIVAASGNALEAAILGKNPTNEAVWERWSLEDAGRAELPMTAAYSETYPVGMAVDTTSAHPIPMGDNQVHAPSPLFLLLSTEGVLSTFHMVDSRPNSPSLQRPAEPLTSAGARLATGSAQPPAPKPTAPSSTVFGKTSFGSQPSAAAPSSGLAQPSAPQSGAAGMFGTKPAADPNAGATGLFGAKTSTPQSQSSLFGLLSDSKSSAFGGTTATSTAPTGTNLFAAANTAATTAQDTNKKPDAGLFGAKVGDNSKGGLFGQASTENKGGLFGQPAAAGEKTGLFGQGPTGSTAKTNLFGNPSTSTTLGGFSFNASADQKPAFPALDKTAPVGTPQNPAIGFAATAQQQPPAQKPAFSTNQQAANQQKPAVAFSANVSSAAQNVTIQKPSASVAHPAVTATPQKPAVSDTAQKPVAPKSELFGQASGSGFVPVERGTATKSASSAFSLGESKVAAEVNKTPAAQSGPDVGSNTTDTSVKTPTGSGEAGTARAAPGSGRKRGHVTEDPFAKAMLEEMQHFNQELSDLKVRSASLKLDIGNSEELGQLRKNTENMVTFCGEIKAATQSINEDIHELKFQCLESFATLEECQLRQLRHNDDNYNMLLASRALDPISERKLRQIQTHYQYLDAGIRDLDLKLDAEWETYQRGKNGGKSLQTPATDLIYRTLTNNQRIIDTHNSTISNLTSQLTNLRLHNTTSQWNTGRQGSLPRRAGSVQEVTSPAYTPRTLGQRSSRTAQLNRSSVSAPMISSLSPQRAAPVSLSPEKQCKLQEALSQRRITPVKATAPANLSMSRLISAELLREPSPREALFESYIESDDAHAQAENQAWTSQEQQTMRATFSSAAVATKAKEEAKPMTKSPIKPKPSSSIAKQEPVTQFTPQKDANKAASMFGNKPNASTATTSLFGQKSDSGTSSMFGNKQGASSSAGSLFGNKPEVSSTGALGGQRTGFSFSAQSTAFTSVSNSSVTQATAASRAASGQPTGGPAIQTALKAEVTKIPSKSDVTKAPASAGFAFAAPTQGFGFSSQNKEKPADDMAAKLTSAFAASAAAKQFPALASLMQPAKSDDVDQTSASSTPSISESSRSDVTGTSESSSGSGSSTVSFGGGSLTEALKDSEVKKVSGKQSEDTIQTATKTDTTKQDQTKDSFSFVQKESKTTEDGGSTFAFGSGLGKSAFGGSGNFSFNSSKAPSVGFSFNPGSAQQKTTTTSAGNAADGQTTTTSSGGGFSFGTKMATGSSTSGASSMGFSFEGSATKTTFSFADSSTQNAPEGAAGSVGGMGVNHAQGDGPKVTAQPEVKSSSPAPTESEKATADDRGLKGLLSDALRQKPSGDTSTETSTVQAPVKAPVQESTASASHIPAGTPASIQTPDVVTTATTVGSDGGADVKTNKPEVAVKASKVEAAGLAAETAVNPADSTAAASKAPVLSAVLGGADTTTPVPATTAVTADPTPVTATTAVTSATTVSNTVTSGQSIFGTTPVTQSAFGGSAAPSVFGTATAAEGFAGTATSGAAGVFGTATQASTAAGAGIFGTVSTAASTQPFGQPTTTTQPTTQTSNQSVFGQTLNTSQPSTQATSQTVFGQSIPASQPSSQASTQSVFGQPSSTTPSTSQATSQSVFGQTPSTSQPASQTTDSSVFGQSTSGEGGGFGNAKSVFGTPSVTSSSGVFGQPPTTTSSGFGGGFGQSSTFGQTSNTAQVFGSQTNTSTSASVFGGGTSASVSQTGSGFGTGSNQNAATGNGGGGGAVFGGGGGLFSGLGGKPSEENANRNVFGSGTFGGGGSSGQQTPGLFGSTGGGFGTPSSGSGGFAGGSFTSGAGGVASSGFGGFGAASPQTPQNSGGFGAKAAFGTSPGFGGSPAFGSAPAFGSSPGMGTTFGGGGGSVFGSAAGQAATPSGTGFAGFASANAPSFGGLAQQTPPSGFGSMGQQQQQPAPGFGQQQQPSNVFASPSGFGGGAGGGGFGNANQNTSFGQGNSFQSYRG